MNLACVILAAGEGTRMKSRVPKVLHDVCGIPMLGYVLSAVESLGVRRITVVAGFGHQSVRDFVGSRAAVVVQKERKGSGHALMQARKRLGGFSGGLLVLYGDTPLLRKETLERLVRDFRNTKAAGVLLSTVLKRPTGYGRIVRNSTGYVARIVEEANATDAEREIRLWFIPNELLRVLRSS